MFGIGFTELLILLIIIGVVLIPTVFYLLTLQKALLRCSEDNRTMKPVYVWFQLIPIFNLVWSFVVVLNIAKSLKKEMESRAMQTSNMPGQNVGLAMCILSVLSFVPHVGPFLGLASLIFWIIYWVKIARFSTQISA